ncbi:MAG TPA: hypothetical protein VEI97_00430 [bacterium]|nr:hypothetical protein [bacterium]
MPSPLLPVALALILLAPPMGGPEGSPTPEPEPAPDLVETTPAPDVPSAPTAATPSTPPLPTRWWGLNTTEVQTLFPTDTGLAGYTATGTAGDTVRYAGTLAGAPADLVYTFLGGGLVSAEYRLQLPATDAAALMEALVGGWGRAVRHDTKAQPAQEAALPIPRPINTATDYTSAIWVMPDAVAHYVAYPDAAGAADISLMVWDPKTLGIDPSKFGGGSELGWVTPLDSATPPAAVDQARLDYLLKQHEAKDRGNGVTEYVHENRKDIYDFLGLYIGRRDDAIWLRITLGHKGNEWVQFEQVRLTTGDRVIEWFLPGPERKFEVKVGKNNGWVNKPTEYKEWYDLPVHIGGDFSGIDIEDLRTALFHSDALTVRLVGSDGDEEKTFPADKRLRDLRETFELYEALGGK